MPLPPPVPFGDILKEGGGSARQKLLRFPPGLVETAMVEPPHRPNDDDDDDDDDDYGAVVTAYYQLENPGWLTFPFLVHTHLGRVRFCSSSFFHLHYFEIKSFIVD